MSHLLQDQIDAWWNAFQAKAPEIDALFRRKAQWDLAGWMEETLQSIHPHLMWEFGPAVNGPGHRLVITPESRRDLRPVVGRILRSVPPMEGWEFYPYRQPESFEMAEHTVDARTGGDISETFFTAAIGELNKIDLTFFAEGYVSNSDENFSDVFVATETLLGEEVLDKWIGVIEVRPLPVDREADPWHIKDLPQRVAALMQEVRLTLPSEPYCSKSLEEGYEWTLYKIEPKEQVDYPAQSDMFVGKTLERALWTNAHCGAAFDSERFSRCGETFCYVKLDGTQAMDEEKFEDKAEIEDALDAALRPEGVGCVIGGGTGLIYSYIDLALVDVPRGTELVKQVLRGCNINRRSWILFFDTDLQTEWIGIWDDTPPPPLPGVE